MRRFAEKQLAAGALERAHAPAYPWDVAKLMAKQGLLGITIPEADGGQGGTLMDAVLAIEAVASVVPAQRRCRAGGQLRADPRARRIRLRRAEEALSCSRSSRAKA